MLQFIVVGGVLSIQRISYSSSSSSSPSGGVIRLSISRMAPSCLVWKIPSTESAVKDWRNESFSHFRIEKSLSTDVVFAKDVARPPQNDRRWTKGLASRSPQASLNIVWCVWPLMLAWRDAELRHIVTRARCSSSMRSTRSWPHAAINILRRGSRTSSMNLLVRILISCWGNTGGASSAAALLRKSPRPVRWTGRRPGVTRTGRFRATSRAGRSYRGTGTSPSPRCPGP